MFESATSAIRSIGTECSLVDPIPDNCSNSMRNEERRSSCSSSSSATSFHVEGVNEDDSSDESTNQFNNLTRFIPELSLSRFDENALIGQCEICVEEECRVCSFSCCAAKICSSCIYCYLSANIKEGRIRISCPSCSHILTRDQILTFLISKDENGELIERYKRLFADLNGSSHIKTCPQCCAIKQIDKKLFEGVRWRRNIPKRVICDECQFVWCFFCHAPWHNNMNCKEYEKGEKMLLVWASQKEENQNNAQRCPRCKIFISRNGGCPHMICSKCHCDFCYNCGKRRLSMKFLGSHDTRLSPFGCKYIFYPNQSIVRHTVRGLVASAATLAAPVAAVGAVALLAVGTTIGAPTYGAYRLVKHIKKKKRTRRRRSDLPIENDSNEINFNQNNLTNDEDDEDLTRAVQESLVSFQQEIDRRDDSSFIQRTKDDDTFLD